jgi:hypothetical protein
MPSPELFYLHLDGEQRGPYTVPQIDHLLNSGLIAEETLYWREGLDQWAPVTSLVARRKRARPWGAILVGLLVLAGLGLLAAFFGPVIVDGWRETNQHEYTAEAAYWRAREVVRIQRLPRGAVIKFADFTTSAVELQKPVGAVVILRGELVAPSGQLEPVGWQVDLKFDEQRAEWSGVQAVELARQ